MSECLVLSISESSSANFSMCKQSLQINLEIYVLVRHSQGISYCRDVFFREVTYTSINNTTLSSGLYAESVLLGFE